MLSSLIWTDQNVIDFSDSILKSWLRPCEEVVYVTELKMNAFFDHSGHEAYLFQKIYIISGGK